MAITDAYATAAQYRTARRITETAGAPNTNADIEHDLAAVSRMIDRTVGRFFTLDASNVTRDYDPDPLAFDRSLLFVDDLVTAASVTIDTDNDGSFADETALTVSTDYVLWPINAPQGPEPNPYRAIQLTSWGNPGAFRGHRVRVVGTFGWPAVPAAIRTATIELAAILRLQSPRATNQIQEFDQVIAASNEAQKILHRLVAVYKPKGF